MTKGFIKGLVGDWDLPQKRGSNMAASEAFIHDGVISMRRNSDAEADDRHPREWKGG